MIKSCIIQVDCTAKHNNKGAATLRIGTGDRGLGSDFTLQTAESPLSQGRLSVLGAGDQGVEGQNWDGP